MSKRIHPLLVGILLLFVNYAFTVHSQTSSDVLSERIKQIQLDMERTQKELEEGEKKLETLKNQEQRGLEELDLFQKNIQSVNRNLNTIRAEERSLETRIAQAQKDYESSKTELEQRADTYATHLRSMYKRRKHTTMASILRAGSASALMRGIVMARAVAQADMKEIDTWRLKTASFKDATRTLEQALDAKRKLSDAKQREQVTLKNSSAKQQKVIDSIRQDEQQLEQMLEQNRIDYENAQAELDKVIMERERADLPVAASLRNYDFTKYKGKLPWPVQGKVVGTFGRQVDPRTKTVTVNRGIEIETNANEPVHSIGRGEVLRTQYFRGYGNFILISHPPGYYSIYGHLADILVTPGQILREGDIIGTAGNTGLMNESTPILVLEILHETTPQNPISWLAPTGQSAKR